jgi:hypothetical protein
MPSLFSLVCCLVLLAMPIAQGAVLDPESPSQEALAQLSAALDGQGLDIAYNLNVSDVARGAPERPRVGILADIPPLQLPSSPELTYWEDAFRAAEIGAVAFLATQSPMGQGDDFASFYEAWLKAPLQRRYLLSYARADHGSAERVAQVLAKGYWVYHVPQQTLTHGMPAEERGGRLYATVGQRWVLDSEAARDLRNDVPEFLYLGQSLRRNSDSALNPRSRAQRRLAAAEPAVFLKESLGDEFEASTIPEIIVPGGIALGENAVLVDARTLVFSNGSLSLVDGAGVQRILPEEAPDIWKAAFDFSVRSSVIGSDAIVDIDERGRVKISSALEDTDLGFDMVRIDTEPFSYVTRLDVLKSVIVDSRVEFVNGVSNIDFNSEYEVRFLQSDRMRIARTQAAIVYRYQSDRDSAQHIDSWGPDAFRLEGRTDFDGLGTSTQRVARYAAWIALFRAVHTQEIDFSHGRYEFLKIVKAGRATPSRM